MLGGTEISFNTIGNANNLRISWSTVQRAMKHLEQRMFIRRHRGSSMKEYSYEVINCRKEFKETKTLKTRDGRTIDPAKVKRIRPPKKEEPASENYQTAYAASSFNVGGDEDELA